MKKIIRIIIVTVFLWIIFLIGRDMGRLSWSSFFSQPSQQIKNSNQYWYGIVTWNSNQKNEENQENEDRGQWVWSYKDDIISSWEQETWDEYYKNLNKPGDYWSIRIEDKDQYQECDLSSITAFEEWERYEIPCSKDTLYLEYVATNDHTFLVNIYDGKILIIKDFVMMRDWEIWYMPSSIRYSKEKNLAYRYDIDGWYGWESVLFYSTKDLEYTLFIDMFWTEVSLINRSQRIGFHLFPDKIAPQEKKCTTVDTSEQGDSIVKCTYSYKTFMVPYYTRNNSKYLSYENFINEDGWNYQKDINLYTIWVEKNVVCYNDDYAGTCNFWIDLLYNTTTSQITRKDPYKQVKINANDFTQIIEE